jgi:two-component system response regulator PilR (NtrC family)
MCDGDRIEPSDLMLPQRTPRQGAEVAAPMYGHHAGMSGAGAAHTAAPPVSQPAHAPSGELPLDDYISNLERTAIMKALEESRYNKTAAARKLGITFRALRYKLKKLGID